jgi:asparagine synthase (glutamine-hydrolysing)
MCGIFALLNYQPMTSDDIKNQFLKGHRRGPEFSKLDFSYFKMVLGFHRLAINGLNKESNQPLVFNDIILICNGEIYNYKELYKSMNVKPTTDSDCEVIIHLFIRYGIEQTLNMLDGVFSFVLYDNRISHDLSNKLYVARDPYGVRPLYCLTGLNKNYNHFVGIASELKCLVDFYSKAQPEYTISQFTPGTFTEYESSSKVNSLWISLRENVKYFIPTFSHNFPSINNSNNGTIFKDYFEEIYKNVSQNLLSVVHKRCLTTERPIACLLSGGLDSSLITALVNEFYKKQNYNILLETYSIGLKGSEDLKYASIVADYLGTKHTEIIVTEKDMVDIIPELIYTIESYDTTTIRASIGNYLLGKYISKNSQAKVIFNGDGSDELFGGYLYMNKCPDDIEFDKETRRLLTDIHLFDVLRSDKSISSNGLEPRTPFLDKSFVNYYLSIPPYFRNHKNFNKCEKFILRNSFNKIYFSNNEGKQILPDEVLWRKKEAFSDGVSMLNRSLYQILQEHSSQKLKLSEGKDFPVNIETEKYYYKKLFDNYYPNCENIIPYFWMPKYTDATDPSARTLTFYEEKV